VQWFRRGRDRERESPTPAAADGDSPAALREAMYRLNRYINRNSGRLPVESVVAARQVTDVTREIIDTSEVRDLDIYAVISVKGILTDYLPTTLQRYLALDPSTVTVARPSGGNPRDSLREQLESLIDAASNVLVATHEQDADALITQGNFLRTKFSGSDLDL
jgi:hypothetical protein